MTPSTITLITGGSRSGKSRMACERMLPYSRRVFLATAEVTDKEMAERIEKHRKERDSHFVTVEEPLYIARAVREHAPSADAILIDCLTFWLNNLFYHRDKRDSAINLSVEIQEFLRLLEERPTSFVLVTNEINMGVIPEDASTRKFVDQLGWLNQEIAKRSDEVIWMVSGIPQILKKSLDAPRRPPPRPQTAESFPVWEERIRCLASLDSDWRKRARERLREQTRPEGSLGELEHYVERIVAIQEREKPSVGKKRIVIFAGDHGVEKEGVSLYPREVTPAMVHNFLLGGATINAFARSVDCGVEVVDVGVDHEFGGELNLISRKIRRGTSNIREGQAMTHSELLRALETGWERAWRAKEDGMEIVGVGEMGIGNTTAASAVIAAFTGNHPERVTGRGTGIDDAMLQRKIQVIQEALEVNRALLGNPFSILQSLGGFEIAAIAGFVAGAATFRIPCVVDGWIASAGALAVIRSNPNILDYLFFAHESEERGHRILLEELDVKPILRLSMRLGEGTGACLAMGILAAAVRAYCEVATFDEAEVGKKKGQTGPSVNLSARGRIE